MFFLSWSLVFCAHDKIEKIYLIYRTTIKYKRDKAKTIMYIYVKIIAFDKRTGLQAPAKGIKKWRSFSWSNFFNNQDRQIHA